MPLRLRGMLLAVMLAVALLPGRAAAATFTPATTADGVNGACNPGTCTLRDAITAANAGPGNDVSIPAGTYTLNLGELIVAQTMTVAGAGARTTTVNAQGNSRVFNVGPNETTIRGLTITGGVELGPGAPFSFDGEGGGILNTGTLHLQSSAVVGNTSNFTGGGIAAPFKGGGLTTTIDDSLIANNSVAGGLGSGSGGGLSLFGEVVTITNSTVTGNSVSNPGQAQGGGLAAAAEFLGPPTQLTLLNATIAGNTISGASMGFGAGVSGDNFIGPSPLTILTAKNTIVANNTIGGAAQDCALVTAASTSANLSSDSSCGFADAASKQNANPQLGPLANNGGPTDTMAIADTSPALNTGTNVGCPAADQRGIARPQATICDMGAYERKGPDLVVEQHLKKKHGKKGTALASAAGGRKGKRVTLVVTISNAGEQTAKGASLSYKLKGKTRKVQLKGCKKIKLKRKKGKGTRRKKKVGCLLGDIAPGGSKTIRLSFVPRRKGKVVSKVTAYSTIPDADLATNTTRTKVRVKRRP